MDLCLEANNEELYYKAWSNLATFTSRQNPQKGLANYAYLCTKLTKVAFLLEKWKRGCRKMRQPLLLTLL